MFSVFCKRHYAKFLWVSILCCSMGGVCNALQPPQDKPAQQDKPQRPQRGNNDPFFNALLEAFKDASNNRRYLWVLLEHPAIQAEIGLDEAELKTLDELNHKHFEELKAIREKYKDKFDIITIALSPECCGSWENSINMANKILKPLNITIEIKK